VEIRPVTPNKFIKDSMELNDIEGSRPKKDKVVDIKTRDNMNI
jgi:hypothetical protein